MYPARPDEGTRNLLDKPFSLGSTPVMHDSKMMGIVPYLLATSQLPLLPSMAIPGLPSLPNQPTPDKEETYLAEVSHIVEWLQGLGVIILRKLSEGFNS